MQKKGALIEIQEYGPKWKVGWNLWSVSSLSPQRNTYEAMLFQDSKKKQIHQIQQKAPPVLISSGGMLESLPLKQQRIKMMLWDLLGQASLASQCTASAVDVRCGALEARSSKVSWRISSLRRGEKRSKWFMGSNHVMSPSRLKEKKNIEFSVPRHPMR